MARGTVRTKSSDLMSFGASWVVAGLLSQTVYELRGICTSATGNSTTQGITFRTERLHQGQVLRIYCDQITADSTIVGGLSQVLELPSSQLTMLTSNSELQRLGTAAADYPYSIALGPNPASNSPSPLELAQKFMQASTQASFKAFVPSFLASPAPSHITLESESIFPQLRLGPEVQLMTFQSLLVSAQFHNASSMYGVLMEAGQNPLDDYSATRGVFFQRVPNSTVCPSASEIVRGLGVTAGRVQAGWSASNSTDASRNTTILFTRMQPMRRYLACLTFSNALPYSPSTYAKEDDTYFLEVSTLVDPNAQSIRFEKLSAANKAFSDAIRRHVDRPQP